MKFFPALTLLLFTVSMADAETRVRIEGAQLKSEDQLLELMGGRLTHVRNKPASTSRADDAAFLLREVMIKDGYTDVRVDWKIVSSDNILLTVDEGLRLSLGSVTVSGVSAVQAEELSKLFKVPSEKGRPLGSGSAPFREEDVETGISYIKQELNARAFWAAEATITSRETDSETGEVAIEVDVRTGPSFLIGTPRIASPDGRGVSETANTARRFVGNPARTANLNAMRAAVEEAFVSSGYPNATIQMGRTLTDSRFIPEFTIDIGTRVRLNEISLEGLERTNPRRIENRMKRMEGEWYDEAAMNRDLRRFLATGAFSSARVETTDLGDNRIDATLHFSEARAKEVSLAFGAGSYQGAIGRITYSDRNLFGNLLGFSTGVEVSTRGVLGETRITDPWLFGYDVTATARLYALIYGREGYDTFETGLEGKLSRKFGDHYTIELLAGYSYLDISEAGLAVADLGETKYTNPKLRLTQTLDYRDSPVLPKKGWHLNAPIEVGAALGDVSTSYVRAGLNGGWYHRINDTYQVGIGGEWGMIIPSGDGADMPIELRLFNGGARSVRSFPERELGPTSTGGFAVGGEAMWNTNVELIRKVAGAVSAVAFFDAGALSRDYDDLTSAEIELAAGLGLRLDLPIGPVRLEYGYNLTKDEGEPSGTLHFAIGIAY